MDTAGKGIHESFRVVGSNIVEIDTNYEVLSSRPRKAFYNLPIEHSFQATVESVLKKRKVILDGFPPRALLDQHKQAGISIIVEDDEIYRD